MRLAFVPTYSTQMRAGSSLFVNIDCFSFFFFSSPFHQVNISWYIMFSSFYFSFG